MNVKMYLRFFCLQPEPPEIKFYCPPPPPFPKDTLQPCWYELLTDWWNSVASRRSSRLLALSDSWLNLSTQWVWYVSVSTGCNSLSVTTCNICSTQSSDIKITVIQFFIYLTSSTCPYFLCEWRIVSLESFNKHPSHPCVKCGSDVGSRMSAVKKQLRWEIPQEQE